MNEAVHHISINIADTTVGTVKFTEMKANRVLKLTDIQSYAYDEEILKESEFIFSRDRNGGFFVELVFKDENRGMGHASL